MDERSVKGLPASRFRGELKWTLSALPRPDRPPLRLNPRRAVSQICRETSEAMVAVQSAVLFLASSQTSPTRIQHFGGGIRSACTRILGLQGICSGPPGRAFTGTR